MQIDNDYIRLEIRHIIINPMKILAVTLLLFSFVVTKSYCQKPTLEETQSWIKRKIEDYGDATGGNYSVSFNNTNIKIAESGMYHATTYVEFNVLDLESIQLRPFSNGAGWLIFYFKPNSKVNWTNTFGYSSNEKIELNVTKDFQTNNLLNRTRDAFNRLIELFGGRPISNNEAF
jgi:hypothetical protein